MSYTKLLPVVFLISSLVCHAQQPTTQKMNIEEATLFLKGAELLSTATVTLPKGESEVLFTNVAATVSNQSLIVNASNGVTVEGATFQNNPVPKDSGMVAAKSKEIKDSIKKLERAGRQIDLKKTVIDREIEVLQANQRVNGLSVTELQKLLELVNSKMEGYLTGKEALQNAQADIDAKIAELNSQLTVLQKPDPVPGGQLLIKFYALEGTTSEITVKYVVPNAGWTPMYDILAEDIHSPVKLYYKANVYQNCGIKWDNIHLILSTGNPTEGTQPPVISAVYFEVTRPQSQEHVIKAYKTPLVDKYDAGSSTSVYQTSRGGDLAIGGARSEGTLYIIDGVQVQGTAGVSLGMPTQQEQQANIGKYVDVKNSGINTTFDIDLPYSIPSDGQQHIVVVKKYKVPATFRYYAVPKSDPDAFLQAQITNWEDLNLLPAQTNIFYEGTYVGQGYIDVRNLKDTLTLSLGRDKKIVIKKEIDKKLRTTKVMGSSARDAFAYNISIRNTRKEDIHIIIQDQIPVSTDREVSIEDEEYGGSAYDEKTGIMKWDLSITSNETKKLGFGYTVKYPKSLMIASR